MDTPRSFPPYTHSLGNFSLPPNLSTPRCEPPEPVPTPIPASQPFNPSDLFTPSRMANVSGVPALSQSQDADFRPSANHLQPNEPHASCIMQATDHHLAWYQNAPYLLLRQQVDNLRRRVFEVETENHIYKQNYDDIIAKLPQLVGMEPDESIKMQPPAAVSQGRIMLGLGWEFPKPLKPEGATLKWWESGRWKEEKNQGGGKPGQHDEGLNLAQHFFEDKNGVMVSGYVAKDIRNRMRACIHSLIWSGQAAPTETNLSHEARAYIHVMIARAFEFLRYCDNGTWKTDALLKQMYTSVVKPFAIEGPVPKKCKKGGDTDPANKRAKSNTPASRASSITPVPISHTLSTTPVPPCQPDVIAQPAFLPSSHALPFQFSPAAPLPPMSADPAPLPSPSTLIPSASFDYVQPRSPSLEYASLFLQLNAPHSPSATPSASLLPGSSSNDGQPPSESPSFPPSSAPHLSGTPPLSSSTSPESGAGSVLPLPPPLPSPSPPLPLVAFPSTSSDAGQLPTLSIVQHVEPASRSTGTPLPPISTPATVSLTGISAEASEPQPACGPPKPRPIVPVKTPFAALQRPRRSICHSSVELQPGTEVLEPAGPVPSGEPSSTANTADRNDSPSEVRVSDAGPEAAPKATSKPARRRMPKDHEPARLAYQDGIASEQNLYLKRLLDADPDLSMTHAQFKEAFKQLPNDTIKELRKAASDACRAKRAKPPIA